jgi:hypothetical protein
VTSDGTLRVHSLTTSETNPSTSQSGLSSALEWTLTHFAVAHDLSHSVRFIDPSQLPGISAAILPGFISGFCVGNNDRLAVADDRRLSLLDAREQNPVVQRSAPLSVIRPAR